MIAINSDYAKTMFDKSTGEEKMKWWNSYVDLLKYEDNCKREFIDNVLVPNFGFKIGKDTLTVSNE